MFRVIKADLFDYVKTVKNPCIAHVVNNKRAMGSGFVVPLMQNFPKIRDDYKAAELELGELQVLKYDNILVANMCAQTLGGHRPLYYNHLVRCMEDLASGIHFKLYKVDEIVCPRFGSGLAGGNAVFIEELIKDCWVKEGINVTICEI